MSNKDLSSKPTYSRLSKLELEGEVPIHVPDDVLEKIKFLCKMIPKHEWSGILFYTVEGSIKKPTTMKITLKDILLMDKGTKTGTEFDWGEDLVQFQMDNPEAIDMIKGNIHSHNDMNVFFSGTDDTELNDNCQTSNFYLCVIVNNWLDMKGKIAFTAEPKSFACLDEEGKPYNLKLSKGSLNPYMFVIDCVFTTNQKVPKVSKAFAKRLEEVEEKGKVSNFQSYKDKVEKTSKDEKDNKNKKPEGNKPQLNLPYSKSKGSEDTLGKWDNDWNKFNKEYNDSIEKNIDQKKNLGNNQTFNSPNESANEKFATFVMRLGNHLDKDSLENAIEDIDHANLSGTSMAQSIIDGYTAWYDQFFDDSPQKESAKVFVDVLDDVIRCYEEYEGLFDFLDPIIAQLKSFGNKFEALSLANASTGGQTI